MRQTLQVIYRLSSFAPLKSLSTAVSVIDTGPDCEVTYRHGTLYLKGPEIDYELSGVEAFSIERVIKGGG